MTPRKTALASLFVLTAIFYVAAQTRPTISVETQFQRQEDHIISVDQTTQENKAKIQALENRLAQDESSILTYRGMLLGFGGLLAFLQLLPYLPKRKGEA